jgi:hypothetical protein
VHGGKNFHAGDVEIMDFLEIYRSFQWNSGKGKVGGEVKLGLDKRWGIWFGTSGNPTFDQLAVAVAVAPSPQRRLQ